MAKRNTIAEGIRAVARVLKSVDEGMNPGRTVTKWIRCGKPKCKCNQGGRKRHGPYLYRQWRDGDTVKSVYVGRKRKK